MSNKIKGENDKLGKCLQIYDRDNYLNIYYFKIKKIVKEFDYPSYKIKYTGVNAIYEKKISSPVIKEIGHTEKHNTP